MPTVFTVTGNQRYRDVLLQADTLIFESNSRLIIAPPFVDEKEKASPAPRTLTIIVGEIVIADNAEITYDLDGQFGLDPYTPAPSNTSIAANGSEGSTTPGEGDYPRAKDGGDGYPGSMGTNGSNGRNAPTLEIFVDKISSGNMTINLNGQDGGKGGTGGDGGPGGNGQKGAASTTSDSWYDGEECTRESGRGGNGGKGGDAGYPGRGGSGGNGGIIKVFVSDSSLEGVYTWKYFVKGGKGGDAGHPGILGAGGKGGPQGNKNDPCPERSEYAGTDGSPGRSMDEIDPDWSRTYKGEDGKDGYWSADILGRMPK